MFQSKNLVLAIITVKAKSSSEQHIKALQNLSNECLNNNNILNAYCATNNSYRSSTGLEKGHVLIMKFLLDKTINKHKAEDLADQFIAPISEHISGCSVEVLPYSFSDEKSFFVCGEMIKEIPK